MSDDDQLKRDEAKVRRDFWRKLGAFAAQIPFAEEALTAYYCAFDRRTPTHVRVALMGALVYFISPIDILPDLLPIVGFADDAAVIAGSIRARGAGADQQSARDLTRVTASAPPCPSPCARRCP
jgi:uncharacterized membrane protein YkvA (DUF1232 family)